MSHPPPPSPSELTAWTRESKRGHRLNLCLLAAQRKEESRNQGTLAYSLRGGEKLDQSLKEIWLWTNLLLKYRGRHDAQVGGSSSAPEMKGGELFCF